MSRHSRALSRGPSVRPCGGPSGGGFPAPHSPVPRRAPEGPLRPRSATPLAARRGTYSTRPRGQGDSGPDGAQIPPQEGAKGRGGGGSGPGRGNQEGRRRGAALVGGAGSRWARGGARDLAGASRRAVGGAGGHPGLAGRGRPAPLRERAVGPPGGGGWRAGAAHPARVVSGHGRRGRESGFCEDERGETARGSRACAASCLLGEGGKTGSAGRRVGRPRSRARRVRPGSEGRTSGFGGRGGDGPPEAPAFAPR